MKNWGILLSLSLVACGKSRPSWTTTLDSSKTAATPARTEFVDRLLRVPAPGPVLDADYREESIGNGLFGPTDRRFFMRVKLRARDVPAWRKILGAPITTADGPPAIPGKDWWPARFDADHFYFFSCAAAFWGMNGWVAVPKKNAEFIFVYSHST